MDKKELKKEHARQREIELLADTLGRSVRASIPTYPVFNPLM